MCRNFYYFSERGQEGRERQERGQEGQRQGKGQGLNINAGCCSVVSCCYRYGRRDRFRNVYQDICTTGNTDKSLNLNVVFLKYLSCSVFLMLIRIRHEIIPNYFM